MHQNDFQFVCASAKHKTRTVNKTQTFEMIHGVFNNFLDSAIYMLSRATYPGAPSYGGVRINLMTDYLKLKNTDRLWTYFTKAG